MVNHLHEHGFNLPDYAQYSVEEAETRVDFVHEAMVAIHIDGPHHDGEQQQRIDDQRRAELELGGPTWCSTTAKPSRMAGDDSSTIGCLEVESNEHNKTRCGFLVRVMEEIGGAT